jgi:hypothetical protein
MAGKLAANIWPFFAEWLMARIYGKSLCRKIFAQTKNMANRAGKANARTAASAVRMVEQLRDYLVNNSCFPQASQRSANNRRLFVGYFGRVFDLRQRLHYRFSHPEGFHANHFSSPKVGRYNFFNKFLVLAPNSPYNRPHHSGTEDSQGRDRPDE